MYICLGTILTFKIKYFLENQHSNWNMPLNLITWRHRQKVCIVLIMDRITFVNALITTANIYYKIKIVVGKYSFFFYLERQAEG